MPQYRIQDSETGRTLLVEGDSPPSESEMAELFSQAAPAAPQQPQDASQDMLLTDEGPAGGMPPEASQDNGKGRIRSAAAEVGRSAVEGFGLGFKGLGIANTRIGPSPYASLAEQFNLAKTGLANPPADMTPGYRTGQAITEAGNRTFQPNPKYQGEWLASKIPQGLGSTVAFLPATVAGPAGVATTGALVNGAAAYDEAKQKGADDDQATRTFWWNALGGTSEAFPLSRIIDRINKASKGAVGKWVKDVIASGFEEGVQEGAQQALQNIVAKHIYEPERKALEGVAEGAGVGAAVGLLLPGVGGGVKIAGQKAGEAVRQKYLRESTGMVPGGGTGGMIPVEPETPPTGGRGGTAVNFKTSDGSEGTLKLAPGTDPKVGVNAVKAQHKGATITGFEALPGPANEIAREQAEAGVSQGVAPSRFSSPVDAAIMASAPTEARVTPATAPEENLPPPGPPTSPVAVSAAEPESQAVTPTPPAPPVGAGVSTTEEESQADKGTSDATGVREEAGLVPAQGVPVEGSQTQGGNQLEPVAPEQPKPVGTGEAQVAKKKRGFALTQRQLFQRETVRYGFDILAWIADQMPLMSKTHARKRGGDFWRLNKSMWDDTPGLANPRHNQIYAREGGNSPDRVAQAAFDAGLINDPSVTELWSAIGRASSQRAGNVKSGSKEEGALDAMANEYEQWTKATQSGAFQASADDLNPGDVLDVEGEAVRVKSKDPATGELELDDGKRFGRQTLKAGQTIWVEKATLADGTVVEPEGSGLAPGPIEQALEQAAKPSPNLYSVASVPVAVGKGMAAIAAKVASIPRRIRMRSAREKLLNDLRANESWRNWYERHDVLIRELFGSDARLFKKLLAVTSQNASVASNITYALKAFSQLKNGEPFTGFLGPVKQNLERIRLNQEPGGRKIQNYTKAMLGDPNAIVIDRHMVRHLFRVGGDTPTKGQYDKAEAVIRELASAIGWTPREVQAALWAARIKETGATTDDYQRHLERIRTEGLEESLRRSHGRTRQAGSGDAAAGRGAEPVPSPDSPATIEDKLRALKTNTRGMVMDVGAATYYSLKNAILDVAIGFIKVGKALDAAVRDAIAWGRVNFPKVKFDAVQMEKDIYAGLASVQGFSTGGLRGVQRVVRALDKDPVTAEKVSAQPFDPENIPTLMGKLSRPSAVTENFDRQLQAQKEAANTEDAYTKAAVLTMQAQLLRNMEESFYGKDPKLIPWWVKLFIPRQRLNEAHRAATAVAASMNVTQADMLNGYTFEPFEMRAGPVPASVIEKAGLQPGDTWQSQNWRGQKELLTIGPKIELEDGRTIYQLLRPMSVQTQKEVWQWFQQTYPEFEWLIDMWVNPALKGARETVNGVEVPIFNRWALMDRYGESDPKFAPREAYTPDVLVPSLLAGATAKWLKERKWTFREGVKSPGRKYETGAARESGAVLDLISGWSVRAAQVLREESRKRWLNQVIAAAVDVPNGNPSEIPKGWVKLENAIDDVWTAVQSMREWHGKGFPQVEATFADRNSPEFKAYFSELQKLHYLNRPKMLPKQVAESLIRDWEQQDNLGMMARTAKAIHQFVTKDPALSEEWARKMRKGMEGWAMNYKAFLLLMPRTYLVNRTDNYLRFAYAAWQRMVYAAMRGGDREAFGEARHLLWASMANLMPGVRQAFHLGENKLFNEAVTRSLVPQLFEQQTNLADLQVFGASVRDQVRSLYDQGLKKQAAALMAKNAGVLSLEATGYGNLDIAAKQQMAFNLLLADAKQQANRLGLKGAARKEAIAAFVLHPPSEKLAAAIKYTNRALLNYSDTPQWINWAARHPAVSTFIAFPIFRYHWLSREIDRATRGFKLEWDRLVKHKKISKEERANAWADFISWATMPAMGWGAANIAYALADSVLGLSAGADDEDDDPRKLVGSSTTIELDDEGKANRKSMARDLVTSNRINMNRVGRMFGLDTAGDEDWWLYIKGLPIIQSASLFHLAQSDARKFGFATGMKTALVGMRDLLSDMTGVGQAPKFAIKLAAELANDTNKPAYSWIDPYATSVPLSAYTTLLALQLIPGQRQADELLKWMDPTPRRITASKSLDYDPGVIEAIKQGGWTGIAHRIQRKISSGTFESDLPAKGHINRRLGEVDKPVTYGLAARIGSLAGFNVKPVNRQEYEEQLDE